MDDYKKILIVRTDRIGDVILTTPSIKALKEAFPNAEISLVVAKSTQRLLLDNPYLDEVIVDDRSGKHKGFFGFLSLVSLVKKKNFDLAIIYHTKKRTNLLCAFAGIPQRIGYKNNKFGFLLTDPIIDTRHEGKKHESEYCLDVLKSLGIQKASLDMHISVKQGADMWARNFIGNLKKEENERVVVIHPGASDPSKRWPESKFVDLIMELKKKCDCLVILAGDKNISFASSRIANLVKGYVEDLTGSTTLTQFIALIKHTDLLISNDSGPVHIAAALKIPVVSIFTRDQPGINPERWRPLGKHSTYVCAPANEDISFEKAGEISVLDIETIDVETVLEAVDSIIKL